VKSGEVKEDPYVLNPYVEHTVALTFAERVIKSPQNVFMLFCSDPTD
jgi:hypothetical protein